MDQAFYYIIYFSLGYLSFPFIRSLFSENTGSHRIIIISTGLISLTCAVALFCGAGLFDFVNHFIPIFAVISPILTALTLIWANIIIAFAFKNVHVLRTIGQNTLYLCGNEYIIKETIPILLGSIGLSLNINNPIAAVFYTVVQLLVVCYLFAPIEQRLINRLRGRQST